MCVCVSLSVRECTGVLRAYVCVYVCPFNRQNRQLTVMVVEAESVELQVESRAQCQRNIYALKIDLGGGQRAGSCNNLIQSKYMLK